MSTLNQEIPEGYKQTEVGVIPEDWDCVTLGDLGDIVRGGSPRPAGDPKYFNGNYIPWLTVASLTNIPTSKQEVTSTLTKLTELGSKQSRVLDAGTLIISNSGATLGVAKILGLKCCANDGVAAIINQKKGNKSFITHYINTQTKRLHDDVATGNGQPNLNTDLIKLIPTPFPSESEQTVIANALSDVDALLTELEKLIAKKQAIKTATMQQLLTGKTRLPQFATYTEEEWQARHKHSSGTNVNVGACDDGSQSGGMDSRRKGTKTSELGEIPEDWDVKTYGEVFSFLTTASNSRSDLSEEGDIGYIHYGDIHTKWNYLLDITKTGLPHISNEKVTSAAFLKDGDIVMADASEDYEGIGKSVEITGIGEKKVISGLHTFLLRDKSNVFSEGYRGYLHSILAVKSIFDRLATGLKVYGLSKSNLKDVPLPVPPKKEQTAIATILSDMDNEIQTLEQRLAKTRQIKQGMMQELLTGRTRLPFEQAENLEVANAN
ncbi:restriction endonuclease subunit S [Pseudoalteromonas sp. CO325X]|uniref:restriction endonuclease subunit S n=1 Tax=Pseudoalteromonas sp. CO325X TaxID=1777262 RepID=UPI0010232A47|nr:restriction endonuclease subunit S [Pseudoalteromonas sp. CO325X]RZF77749.1 restriction endonuclease subunit S [Pseudoalteromonas sp. CO325X]